jgi:hypothetical protein
VEQCIALIESDRNIGLIERPEYKRRWSWTPWEEQERDALRGWLLDRIEALFSGRIGPETAGVQAPEPKVTATVRLADGSMTIPSSWGSPLSIEGGWTSTCRPWSPSWSSRNPCPSCRSEARFERRQCYALSDSIRHK